MIFLQQHERLPQASMAKESAPAFAQRGRVPGSATFSYPSGAGAGRGLVP
jgi:hypothetical protein